MGALLVYDIANYDSFENLQYWLEQLEENADPNVVVCLIGKRRRLTDRQQVRLDVPEPPRTDGVARRGCRVRAAERAYFHRLKLGAGGHQHQGISRDSGGA